MHDLDRARADAHEVLLALNREFLGLILLGLPEQIDPIVRIADPVISAPAWTQDGWHDPQTPRTIDQAPSCMVTVPNCRDVFRLHALFERVPFEIKNDVRFSEDPCGLADWV